MISDEQIDDSILRLTEARKEGRTICPSEVARDLAEEWRPLLSRVRRQAGKLAVQNRIEILRHGKVIPPEAMRGVIRLRLKVATEGEAVAEGAMAAPDTVPPAHDEGAAERDRA